MLIGVCMVNLTWFVPWMRGRGVVHLSDNMIQDVFNNFIEDSFLVDSPICGRLFTWYHGDGYSMSRLDR